MAVKMTALKRREAAYCKRVQDAARKECVPLGEGDWIDVRYLFGCGKPVEEAIASVVGRVVSKRDSARTHHLKAMIDTAFLPDSRERIEVGPCAPPAVVDKVRDAVEAGELSGEIIHWEEWPKWSGNFEATRFRWEYIP